MNCTKSPTISLPLTPRLPLGTSAALGERLRKLILDSQGASVSPVPNVYKSCSRERVLRLCTSTNGYCSGLVVQSAVADFHGTLGCYCGPFPPSASRQAPPAVSPPLNSVNRLSRIRARISALANHVDPFCFSPHDHDSRSIDGQRFCCWNVI